MKDEQHNAPDSSERHEFGTLGYYRARVAELAEERDSASEEAKYYREQLAKAHELLGRVLHQTSERWDSVRLSEYFPTDNLHGRRNHKNPKGL